MKILLWNARGISNHPTSSLNLKVFAANDRQQHNPNIGCICKDNLDPSLIQASKQHVYFSVFWENLQVYISAIYACTTYVQRRLLWAELLLLQQSHLGPWCYIGDFNALLGAPEKMGGYLPMQVS